MLNIRRGLSLLPSYESGGDKSQKAANFWTTPKLLLAVYKWQMVTALASKRSFNIHILPRILLNLLTKTNTTRKFVIKSTIFQSYSVVSATTIVLVHNWARFCRVGAQHLSILLAQAPSPLFSLRPPPTIHTAFLPANENYKFSYHKFAHLHLKFDHKQYASDYNTQKEM
jgi:hypothetical protein